MSYTPGPWKIASTVSAHYIESEGCKDISGYDYEVARVDLIGAPEVRVLSDNVDLANARLIAAAPDLLAALQEWTSMAVNSGLEGCDEILEQAEAAIAKAEKED